MCRINFIFLISISLREQFDSLFYKGGKKLKISRTNNFELVAKLNKYVHDLHVNLYPEYFKEYNYDEIKEFFQKIIGKEKFTFLLLEDDD